MYLHLLNQQQNATNITKISCRFLGYVNLFIQGAANDIRSPFCTGSPINTLAEPEDLVIVCGEFNSGVQIISQSEEPDQVFNVKKIVNYPHYNPKRVYI